MEEKQKYEKALSLVIPVYNEIDNLRPLLGEIRAALPEAEWDYELLFVDDGSNDGSSELILALESEYEQVRGIRFRRNYGQTAAFTAGFDHALGRIVVTLDADRQNDPADIPALVAHLDETGVDVVNGWRKDRQDGFLLRKIPSQVANWLIATTSGVKLRDRGCSLRAFRLEVVQELHLYGEMHRFIPELIDHGGFSMSQQPVNHRPRVAGVSKYGLSRTFRVLLDLMTILFLRRYSDRPMHLFGSFGILLGGLGTIIAGYLAISKLWGGVMGGWVGFHAVEIGNRPLLLLGVVLIILGTQFLLMGLLAELIVRTYYESQGKAVYRLK